MVQRTKNQNTLSMGDWNTQCERCDFKFKASDLKKEWTGLYTCRDCFEPRHPQDFLEGVPDDPSVPWSRPETPTEEYGYVRNSPPTIDDSGIYVQPGYVNDVFE